MSDVAIRFDGVGKRYKIFASRRAAVRDALGLYRRGRRPPCREFWALRGIDLELRQGERLGIIGRNGAGKSTLLKLVTENVPATEGTVEVHGNVQALLDIGGGLHPEFTGIENIEASLAYLGLSRAEIVATTEEIAEFTELGRFLEQPFKTYSQGMQARLSFAIATAVRPEILIVDEILGAGDAYFFTKSTGRMLQLMEGGASILLVSHALDQIIRFCERAVWLDRGRIAMEGPSQEVVKAYERFVRELEDKRLLAQNRKATTGRFDAFEREGYTDQLQVELGAAPAGTLDVRQITLLRDGGVEDTVAVGDAQDASGAQAARVDAATAWSPPQRDAGDLYRRLDGSGEHGRAVFDLWFYYPASQYAVEVEYRATGGDGRISCRRAGGAATLVELPASDGWTSTRLVLPAEDEPGEDAREARTALSRWPGEGSLVVDDVTLFDGEGNESAVFTVDTPMRMTIGVRAVRAGRYPLTAAATLYRGDGILVTNHIGGPFEVELEAGERRTLEVDFGQLNLGNGRYVFSIALYRKLAVHDPVWYDMVDRSYEFDITGNAPFDNGVFRHGAAWSIAESAEPAPPMRGS